MPTQKVNGVELYYELHGPEDGEVVVLSNGVLMSTASWGLQVAEIAKRFRVLLYDCRGMWRSEHPRGPYTMELHADDLAGLLDGLDFPAAHIAGISYGGELSMVFAAKYPQRTKSLILSSTVSESDAILQGMADSWLSAAKAHDGARLYEASYSLNFSNAYLEANKVNLASAAARYDQLDMNAVVELMNCFKNFNFTAELQRIKAPTLIMIGENDILKPRKYSELIAKQIVGSQLVVVPGAGHALCLEKPAIFNALVLGFVERCKDIQASTMQ